MRTIIAFTLALLSGCTTPYTLANSAIMPAQVVATSCAYGYDVPRLPAGLDPECEISTGPASFTVTTTTPYTIALTLPADWSDTTAMALNQPGASLAVGGFQCSSWAGLVTWGHNAFPLSKPNVKLWYVEISAQCVAGPDAGFIFDVTLTESDL